MRLTLGGRDGRRHGFLFSLILVAAAALRLASFQWNQRLQGDVNLFALTAREFVRHNRLYYPFRWEYSDHVPYLALSTPSSQHPLLWPLASGLLGKLFGTEDTFLTLKLLSEIGGLALIVLAVWALRRWRRSPAEILAAVGLLALAPMLVDFSGNGSMYIASAAVLIAATVLLYGFRYDRMRDYVAAGALCGVALQIHNVLILLPVAFLIFWIAERRRVAWRRVAAAAVAGLLVVGPWLWWNYQHFGRLFYSYSTYFDLIRFGLAKAGLFGDVVTTRSVRAADLTTLRLYLKALIETAGQFLREYTTNAGPFVLLLIPAGLLALWRQNRRLAAALLLPSAAYTLTVILWATYKERFLVPALPLGYILAAAGFAYLWQQRIAWRLLGSACLAGAVVWQMAGFLDSPPTRYYNDDAPYAAAYARMLDLTKQANALPDGVTFGYSRALDGGMETVYWRRGPLVYGPALPIDAVQRMVRDFAVKYVWTSRGADEKVRAAFPGSREVLANEEFSVYEVPDFLDLSLPAGLTGGLDEALAADPHLAGLDLPAPARPVVFGGQYELVGYNVTRLDDGGLEDRLVVRLLWSALSPQPAALQFFVHVAGDGDRLLAQYDRAFGRWPDQPLPEWPQGTLMLQQANLPLPANTDLGSVRIYVGLYRLDGLLRLPLSVDGVPQPEARYSLDTSH